MFLYTVVFCVLAPLVFFRFAADRTFVWKGDGFNQHVKAIFFYSQYLRSLLFDHVLQGNFDLPTYAFTLGQGGDVLTTLHYYAIGDPLLLLSIFVPSSHVVELYDGLVLLRFYLAGAAFLLYLRHMNRRGSFGAGGFETSGMIAGTLVYMFCGFALVVIRHPFFLNPMIYLPLILVGAEKVLDGERPTLLVASVFAASVSNFYFFYTLGILTALYAVLRVLSRRPKNFKNTLLPLLKIAACAALGALLSSAVLFPVLRQLLGSSRMGNSPIWSLLYTPSQYRNTIAYFILPRELHNWTVLGYAVVALFAVVHLWLKKGSRDLKAAFAVLSAMLMIPAVGFFMNGFSYVSNKWEFGLSFLVAYLVVVEWKSLFAVERKKILCVVLASYMLFSFLTIEIRGYLVFLSLLLAASVAVAFAGRPRLSPRSCRLLLLALVAVNLAGNACFLYVFKNPPYAQEYTKYGSFQQRFFRTEADAIRAVEKTEKTGFFRYAGNGATYNDAVRSGLHGVDFYWSLGNGDVAEFRKDMRFSDSAIPHMFKTFDSCTVPTSLANVKYLVQPGDVRPFGYSAVSSELPDKDCVLLVNDNFVPFGYTYSRALSTASYKALSPIEMQEALLQACVVDDPADEGPTPFEPVFSSKIVPFKLRLGPGVAFKNGLFTVRKANAECSLSFEGIGGSETYLHVEGLHYLGRRYLKDASLFSTEKAVSENDKKQFYRNLFDGKIEFKIRISSTNEAGDGSSAFLDYKSPKYSWYSGRHDFMVNFGYDAGRRTSIAIQFPAPGTYSVDKMSVVCLPFDRYDERVSALTEDVLRDVDFHEDSAFATDRVTGAISLSTPKYLLMTIPYSTGWSALVDGKKQEILRANVMHSALFLPAGEHEIEMRYRTPWLREGLCVSAAAALAWLILEIFMRRRGRKDR